MNVNVINNAPDRVHVYAKSTIGSADSLTVIIDPKNPRDYIKLRDVAGGNTFQNDCGAFIALEHFSDGTTAVIQKDITKKMKFGENNDWRESEIRKDLNSEYLEKLNRAFGADNIIEHKVDLLSLDGLDDYGISTDKVSLLTIDQYRKYRLTLGDNLDSWWWLATPDSTPNGVGAGGARFVDSSGLVNYCGCGWDDFGVRPFLILKSDILVSCEK